VDERDVASGIAGLPALPAIDTSQWLHVRYDLCLNGDHIGHTGRESEREREGGVDYIGHTHKERERERRAASVCRGSCARSRIGTTGRRRRAGARSIPGVLGSGAEKGRLARTWSGRSASPRAGGSMTRARRLRRGSRGANARSRGGETWMGS
jgi:hypothetical protein